MVFADHQGLGGFSHLCEQTAHLVNDKTGPKLTTCLERRCSRRQYQRMDGPPGYLSRASIDTNVSEVFQPTGTRTVTLDHLFPVSKDQVETENKVLATSNEVGDWTLDSQPEEDTGEQFSPGRFQNCSRREKSV